MAKGYSRLLRADIAIFAGSPSAIAAIEDLQTAAFDDAPGAVAALDEGKQDVSPLLDGLADLDASLGLIEQIDDTQFGKRGIGVATADSIPDRAAADSRYSRRSAAVWAVPTGSSNRATYAEYSAPTISATPTQAEVQAIADHVAILSSRLATLINDLKATGALS